jgi:hypothetical protein
MGRITEKTEIPIGMAILAIGGGAIWLTTMAVKATAVETKVERLDQRQEAINNDLIEIKTDLKAVKRYFRIPEEK